MKPRLILASASPQRARLLEQLGLRHTAIPADIDETPRAGESAEALAERLARTKAEALSIAYPEAVIVGSDTVVAREGDNYGKPAGDAEARTMLTALAGRTHRVATGVAVFANARTTARVCVSRVILRAMSTAEIAAYVATGEPLGKAGGYAIQGRGALFVERLEGSYSAVMGLPLFETGALLAAAGVDALEAP